MHRNPYIAGNPISDNAAFFGRDDVFREVIKLLRHPEENSIVLYGQRRIGKTSVLMQLGGRLAQEEGNPFCPVYFDLQDKAALPLAELLYGLALQITALTGQPSPDRERFDPAGEFFQSNFLPAASQAAGKTIVLLFDEFDVLDSPIQEDAVQSPAIQSFFPYLRRWMAAVRNVKFVFVIGRRPEELSIKTNAMFKATRTARISLLSKSAAVEVIRQSERQGSLTWDPQAIEAVWGWTHGHPYLMQLLCSVLWEDAVFAPEQAEKHLLAADVEQAVPAAIKQGDHAFHWIWDGLPPAEKTVIAAMAEAPGEAFTQDNLIELLNQSGVRLILRELELAPETLAQWEVLYKEGDTYHFSVPLLRRWVADRHPLSRVKEELDRLDPTADALYQSGLGYYQTGNLDESANQLKRALDFNPNHLKSRLLLGGIAFEQKRLDAAVNVLEEAFRFDPIAARAELIKTLLARAAEQAGDAQVSTYERVLQINPNQPKAQEQLAHHFQVAQVQDAIGHETREQWDEATKVYDKILERYPDTPEVIARLQTARTQARLAQAYREALGALKTGEPALAKPLLGRILGQDPDYKDATQLLLRAQTEEREATQKANDKVKPRENYKVVGLGGIIRFLLPSLANVQSFASDGAAAFMQQSQVVAKHKSDQKTVTYAKWQTKAKIRGWVVSTLSWWPCILLSFVAVGTSTEDSEDYLTFYICRTVCFVSVLAWLLTGWHGMNGKNKNLAIVLGVTASVCAYFLAATFSLQGTRIPMWEAILGIVILTLLGTSASNTVATKTDGKFKINTYGGLAAYVPYCLAVGGCAGLFAQPVSEWLRSRIGPSENEVAVLAQAVFIGTVGPGSWSFIGGILGMTFGFSHRSIAILRQLTFVALIIGLILPWTPFNAYCQLSFGSAIASVMSIVMMALLLSVNLMNPWRIQLPAPPALEMASHEQIA